MTDDQQRARELLAQEYESRGLHQSARDIRTNRMDEHLGWVREANMALAAITTALRAAPEGFVMVPVDSVLPCGCGCYRVCCRSCGTELGGFDVARPQVQP